MASFFDRCISDAGVRGVIYTSCCIFTTVSGVISAACYSYYSDEGDSSSANLNGIVGLVALGGFMLNCLVCCSDMRSMGSESEYTEIDSEIAEESDEDGEDIKMQLV